MIDALDFVFMIFFTEGCLLVFVNTFSLHHILSSKKRFKQNKNEFFLCLLFGSHCCSGISVIAVCTFELWVNDMKDSLQLAYKSRKLFASISASFTIFVCVERFIAIRKPFFYAKTNARHAFTSVFIFLTFPIVFFIWNQFSPKAFIFAFVVIFTGAIFITIGNITLYRSIKRQCNLIASTIVNRCADIQKQQRNKLRKRQLVSLRICLLIAITYLMTWLSLALFLFLKEQLGLIGQFGYIDIIFEIIAFSNGLWDVGIFFYTKRKSPSSTKTTTGTISNQSTKMQTIRRSTFQKDGEETKSLKTRCHSP